ncbi:MAG: ankyrin repeat domain-containing protein, partial [Planctomycetaceae bacterium]|nr:ankyrin repeat domain-containing protein [Planctomycetaceae bacterium]
AEIRHDSEQVEGVIHSPPGYPVLQMAARHGSIEAMQCLIELGMDVNDKTAFDMTPLHYAANVLEIEAMELLLKNGADVNAIHWRPGGYRQYFTPLDLINRFEKNYKRGCTTDLDDNEILVFADIERIKDVLYNAGAKTAEELQPEQQE